MHDTDSGIVVPPGAVAAEIGKEIPPIFLYQQILCNLLDGEFRLPLSQLAMFSQEPTGFL